MKKLMTALAVCLAAGFVSAAGVASGNVVGYFISQQDDVGNILGAVAFNQVGGTEKTLNTLLDATQLEFGDNAQLLNSNGVSFDGYIWWGDHWENEGGQIVGVDVSDVPMGTGKGFFLVCASVRNVFASGEVPTNATISTAINSGYNLIGSAYPVPFNLDSYDWSSAEFGDEIQLYDPLTYGFISLLWWGDHWENDEGLISGQVANVGDAFYYVSQSGGWNLVHNSPL